MGKVSLEDKLQIQTLQKQKLNAGAIVAAFWEKRSSTSTVKEIY